MTISRVDAYLAALAKTEGREFDANGKPVLTAVEARILAEAENRDYAETFKRHVAVTLELARLDRLDGEVG